MKCLKCKSEDFVEKDVRLATKVRDEDVEVIVPALVCSKCHTPLMKSEQMNILRKKAADAYRQKHNLLTAAEIVDYRQRLKFSQAEFSKFLSVGEASVKRWETCFVQDRLQDDNIRLKCDKTYAERHLLGLSLKAHEADLDSGNRIFNWDLFTNAVLLLLTVVKSPLFLNKALFYLDFKHFKDYGVGVTGLRYVPLDYGPCPNQYQILFDQLLNDHILVPAKGHDLKSMIKADPALFDDREKATLETILKLAKRDGGKSLLKMSHEEKGFKQTPFGRFISYEYAKNLKI